MPTSQRTTSQPVDEPPGGARDRLWLIVDGDGNLACTVQSGGRRQAMKVVQGAFGGQLHGSGSFYDVLVGHRLQNFRALRAITAQEGPAKLNLDITLHHGPGRRLDEVEIEHAA